jgi:hypothetical protein
MPAAGAALAQTDTGTGTEQTTNDNGDDRRADEHFRGGQYWDRTSDLCRVKAIRVFPPPARSPKIPGGELFLVPPAVAS